MDLIISVRNAVEDPQGETTFIYKDMKLTVKTFKMIQGSKTLFSFTKERYYLEFLKQVEHYKEEKPIINSDTEFYGLIQEDGNGHRSLVIKAQDECPSKYYADLRDKFEYIKISGKLAKQLKIFVGAKRVN